MRKLAREIPGDNQTAGQHHLAGNHPAAYRPSPPYRGLQSPPTESKKSSLHSLGRFSAFIQSLTAGPQGRQGTARRDDHHRFPASAPANGWTRHLTGNANPTGLAAPGQVLLRARPLSRARGVADRGSAVISVTHGHAHGKLHLRPGAAGDQQQAQGLARDELPSNGLAAYGVQL